MMFTSSLILNSRGLRNFNPLIIQYLYFQQNRDDYRLMAGRRATKCAHKDL
ncbi:hypothetical protein HanXRQr2_Chr14g0663811 [Helianthus annuus]|uniref:Uncharacterized protein n=1 Tax=Helianthus annuus TaxID=4232 RepID=A0A9K3ECW2_HELAN|nr:hypothetical protein HanXRQr2_Chr14g0663811 [Helianthus annuus]KAJ0842036.1 hypothetical protein HanPSC8_Chr14g0637101 [Helianthus annuus]